MKLLTKICLLSLLTLLATLTGCQANHPMLMAKTPLSVQMEKAIGNGQAKEVERLLDEGAPPHLLCPDEHTFLNGHWRVTEDPMPLAAHKGDVQIMEILLTAGAPVTPEDIKNPVPGHKEELIWYRSHFSNYPLDLAAEAGHLEAVKFLLEHDADIEAVNGHRQTALAEAAENGHQETVIYLIDQGANPQPGLWWAVREGHLEIVRLLIDNGADPLALESCPRGLLQTENRFEILTLLFKHGLTIEQTGDALRIAAWRADTRVVRLLLQEGADPNSKGRHGMTPLDGAARSDDSKREATLKALPEHGADPAKARSNKSREAVNQVKPWHPLSKL